MAAPYLYDEILLKFPLDPKYLANYTMSDLVSTFEGRTGAFYGEVEDCVLRLKRDGLLRVRVAHTSSHDGVSVEVGWIQGLTELGIRYVKKLS